MGRSVVLGLFQHFYIPRELGPATAGREEGMPTRVTRVVLRVKWRKRRNTRMEEISEEPEGRKRGLQVRDVADGVQWKVYPTED